MPDVVGGSSNPGKPLFEGSDSTTVQIRMSRVDSVSVVALDLHGESSICAKSTPTRMIRFAITAEHGFHDISSSSVDTLFFC